MDDIASYATFVNLQEHTHMSQGFASESVDANQELYL